MVLRPSTPPRPAEQFIITEVVQKDGEEVIVVVTRRQEKSQRRRAGCLDIARLKRDIPTIDPAMAGM